MLSDSKVREVGFIRTHSSKKIIHRPAQDALQSSDSFSSFQYDSHRCHIDNSKSHRSHSGQEHFKDPQVKQAIAAKPPKIPKPQQQNQVRSNTKLNNNFFDSPIDTIQKSIKDSQKLKADQHIPRSETPQFEENQIRRDLQKVNDICTKINNMKLNGNFSFNPKSEQLRIKKQVRPPSSDESDEVQGNLQQVIARSKQVLERSGPKRFEKQAEKPSSRQYFKEKRFQYEFEEEEISDFDSSSASCDTGKEIHRKSYQKQPVQNQNPKQNFISKKKVEYGSNQNLTNFYEKSHNRHAHCDEEHYNLTVQHAEYIERPKVTEKNRRDAGKIQNLSEIQSRNQYQENEEELIIEYNKKSFLPKAPEKHQAGLKSLRKAGQLCENRNQNNLHPTDVYESQGGICFEVNVKDFKSGSQLKHSSLNGQAYAHQQKALHQKKKKKVNQKEEILKRREIAKIYARQSRFRLFGFS